MARSGGRPAHRLPRRRGEAPEELPGQALHRQVVVKVHRELGLQRPDQAEGAVDVEVELELLELPPERQVRGAPRGWRRAALPPAPRATRQPCQAGRAWSQPQKPTCRCGQTAAGVVDVAPPITLTTPLREEGDRGDSGRDEDSEATRPTD